MVKAVLITLDGEVKEVRFPNLKALEGFARFMGLDVDELSTRQNVGPPL